MPLLRPSPLLRLALLAGLGLAAAGCDRPNDQPVLQQELLATAKAYERRLDELSDRAGDLDRRRQAVPHDTLDAAAAEHELGQARSAIEDRRSYLRGVRSRLAGRPGSVVELRALLDELRARLDTGIVEATADLGAVDGWLASAALLPRAGAQPADPEPANPGPEGSESAPETDRTGAPIR
ncbi:MAG TPA: hypothetical protein VHW23_20615 [Kofleriaceae bacterium]|nr:hypothetical protein [Kofleriaceae bacterium]